MHHCFQIIIIPVIQYFEDQQSWFEFSIKLSLRESEKVKILVCEYFQNVCKIIRIRFRVIKNFEKIIQVFCKSKTNKTIISTPLFSNYFKNWDNFKQNILQKSFDKYFFRNPNILPAFYYLLFFHETSEVEVKYVIFWWINFRCCTPHSKLWE